MNNKKKKTSSLGELLTYILKYKVKIIIAAVLVLLVNLLSLLIPYLTGEIVDSIDLLRTTGDYTDIIRGVIAIFITALLTFIVSAYMNILVLKTAQNIVYDLRHDTFEKIMRLPASYFEGNTKGNIISIISTDIDNISETISSDVITLITGVVTVTGSLIFMVSISPVLVLIFVVSIPLMFLCARIISKSSRKLYRKKKNSYGSLCGYAEEMITAQKSVKVYGIEKYNVDRFEGMTDELYEHGKRADYRSSLMMPSMNGINNFNFTFICLIGAYLVLKGSLSVGNISTFIMYSKKFQGPIVDTANILNTLQISLAACDRVMTVLNADEEITEGSITDIDISAIRGRVEFEHVSFAYDDAEETLSDISFTAEPGETVAIVGPTGAGKTTIISLLMRFYDNYTGKITMDGMDIKDIPLDVLRRMYALILQDSWMFTGSVYDNIGYSVDGDVDRESIEKLCSELNIDDFISELRDGYDTILRNDTAGLSAGQKQLLSIARTFMCKPPVFILDEATSSVDPVTETRIKNATDKVTNGRTSFIIAHRLSTIVSADKIIVIQDGKIAEIGTHEELLRDSVLYRDIYESQFVSLDETEKR